MREQQDGAVINNERNTIPSFFLEGLRLLLVAALLVACWIPSFSHAAEQQAMHDALGMTKPWPAPTGHRQPHAADVPQESNGHDQIFVALDRKLRICRGC